MASRLLRSIEVTVADKPFATMRRLLSKVEAPTTKLNHFNVICKIACIDCTKHNIRHSGIQVGTCGHERKLSVKPYDQFSLMSIHEDEKDMRSNRMKHLSLVMKTHNILECLFGLYIHHKISWTAASPLTQPTKFTIKCVIQTSSKQSNNLSDAKTVKND